MRKKIIFFMSFIILLHFSFLSVHGKTKKITALGKYDFYHYYTHEELTNYLKDMNKAYPNLTELKSKYIQRNQGHTLISLKHVL